MGTLFYLVLIMLGVVYARPSTTSSGIKVDDKLRHVCFQSADTGLNQSRLVKEGAVEDNTETAECPEDKPVCGTQATAPDFISELICSPKLNQTCSVSSDEDKVFALTCMCDDDLCNAPFKDSLLHVLSAFKNTFYDKLINEPVGIYDLENFTDLFFTDMLNDTHARYDELTTQMSKRHAISSTRVELLPRAEAWKREATPPPDDDEDETEGSGSAVSTEEDKTLDSAPAALSTPPAGESTAPALRSAVAAAFLACFAAATALPHL